MNVPPGAAEEVDESEFTKAVGARIRAARIRLGLRQEDLGARLVTSRGTSVSASQVSKWELGVNLPNPQYWPQLARELELDIGQLFAGEIGEPAWAVTVVDQVKQLRAEVRTLARLLELDDALTAAVRAQGRVRTGESGAALDERDATEALEAVEDADLAEQEHATGRQKSPDKQRPTG